MKRRSDNFILGSMFGGFILLTIVIIFFSGIIGMFTWPYILNSWLIYAGKSASVVWWHGFLLGLVPYIGCLSIPGAAITWIIMLFL